MNLNEPNLVIINQSQNGPNESQKAIMSVNDLQWNKMCNTSSQYDRMNCNEQQWGQNEDQTVNMSHKELHWVSMWVTLSHNELLLARECFNNPHWALMSSTQPK